jgi:putative two-component system response regulator
MEKPLILCIDDEVNILKSIKRLFIDEDYMVLTTTQGEEGLEILKKEKVNVLITDQQMPGIKGIDIIKQARKISPQTVRIMITGYSDIDITISAINEGEIHRYIAKPWDNDQFKQVVKNALAKNEADKNGRYNEQRIKREMEDLTAALRTASLHTVRALSNAIELKDTYTKGHCDRVLEYTLMIAGKLELAPGRVTNIHYASLLHDIGKIGVPARILNKPGPLNDTEWKLIKKHPQDGAKVTMEIDFLQDTSRIILEHHEKIDGSGYPYGKKGDDILLESKIITIADVFDALTSDRAYRKARSHKEALEIIAKGRNRQFDGKLVDIFIRELEH